MSETLTEPAPADTPDAPSVEDQAPEAAGEVGDGSVQEAEAQKVDAERFNGLMASFNKEKDRASKAEARLAELESQLEERERLSADSQPQETEVSDPEDPRIAQLTEQVAQLTELVQGVAGTVTSSRQRELQNEVFSEYPEAQAFADLIVADDENSFREMAREIAGRVKSFSGQGEQAPTTEEEPTEAPAEAASSHPLEVQAGAAAAGGPPVNPDDEPASRRSNAIQAGDWDSYLSAVADQE